jgi:DNA-binding MarR family transcriptional regulator
MQEYLPALPVGAQSASITAQARFRRVLARVNIASIEQLDDRRERQVYLLTNGTRTIGQIAGLLGIASVEVGGMTKHLVEQGYVEIVQSERRKL